MKKNYLIFCLFLILAQTISAQSVQDCIGAIPVCQNTYNEVNSYSGEGNILDYTGDGGCFPNSLCLTNETNSVWYTFQVQTSGILDFRLTPNGPNTDYDWALFNLTNYSCSDLMNTSLYPQILVSCNAACTYGITGANNLTPNSGTNCEEPSSPNTTPPNNVPINVVAGNIYYLVIQNWTATSVGYLLDFSHSTASIFDNIPPTIINVDTSLSCGATSITVKFSENVLCNTVQTSDFNLTGPDGNHAITSVTGQACTLGGNQENTYVLTFSPPISTGGLYTLGLTGPVTDLCGNVAILANFNFHVHQVISGIINITQPSCAANDGSIEVHATQGSGNYTYHWSTTPVQTGSTASGLGAGTYSVTVTDGGCSATNSATLTVTQLSNVTASAQPLTVCPGNPIILTATGGQTYVWNTSPAVTDSIITVNPATTTTYMVTATNDGCTGTAAVSVTVNPSLTVTATFAESHCNYNNGTATANLSGNGYTYLWNTIPPQNTQTATGLGGGTYTVTVSNNGCTGTASVTINVNTYLAVSGVSTPESCFHNDGTATAVVSDSGSTYTWNTVPPQFTQTATGLTAGSYTVTVSNNGCSGTATIAVPSGPAPKAAYGFIPEIVIVNSGPVTFYDQSLGNIVTWNWDFGDNTSGYGKQVCHTYTDTGSYLLTLIVTDNLGCIDTAMGYIIIHPEFIFWIPNSFTPDGDQNNEVFKPVGTGIDSKNYLFMIFDRWGREFFSTRNIHEGWNGSYRNMKRNNKCNSGAYVYLIKVSDLNGQSYQYKGIVNLIR